MKLLITGAAGQLGQAMVRECSARHSVVATTLAELDIRDARAVASAVRESRPDAVVNCAAYTDVDRAEDEPIEALAVNALAVRGLAAAARAVGACLVHYSTDFVFDGTASVPYSEDDDPNPRSTYACSKLVGEWFAGDVPRHYILRVESLFGNTAPDSPRRTSVDRIVDAIVAGTEARVFTDRIVSPSYIPDVSRATVALLEGHAAGGLYHCVNAGRCTFLELAIEVGRQLGLEPHLVPVAMAELSLRATRPAYCALSNARLAGAGFVMPTWQEGITRYLRERRLLSAA